MRWRRSWRASRTAKCCCLAAWPRIAASEPCANPGARRPLGVGRPRGGRDVGVLPGSPDRRYARGRHVRCLSPEGAAAAPGGSCCLSDWQPTQPFVDAAAHRFLPGGLVVFGLALVGGLDLQPRASAARCATSPPRPSDIAERQSRRWNSPARQRRSGDRGEGVQRDEHQLAGRPRSPRARRHSRPADAPAEPRAASWNA